MTTLTIKRGDTLQLTCNYKQTGTSVPVDLSTFLISVNILDYSDKLLFEITSNAPTANRSVTTSDLAAGTFTFTFKDTEVLVEDVYYIDFKYTTASGVEQTSKAVRLSVKGKLV